MLIARAPDEPSGDYRNRDIDPENQSPALIDRNRQSDNRGAPDRAKYPADGIDRAHDPDRRYAPPGWKEVADQGQRDRQERSAPSTLNRSGGNQRLQRLGIRAKERTCYEDCKRAD